MPIKPELKKEYERQYYQNTKALGLCTRYCGRKAIPGKTRCGVCRKIEAIKKNKRTMNKLSLFGKIALFFKRLDKRT